MMLEFMAFILLPVAPEGTKEWQGIESWLWLPWGGFGAIVLAESPSMGAERHFNMELKNSEMESQRKAGKVDSKVAG
jgi:hypothetical protein